MKDITRVEITVKAVVGFDREGGENNAIQQKASGNY